MSRTGRKTTPWWSLAILLQPFLLLWWMLPGIGGLSIANDYPVYCIEHQMELMFSVWNGSFPLFVPGFYQGQTASALTLGQIYHPISWLCSIMPGYRDGLALVWNTLFRLLTLGLAQLALFSLLRRVSIGAFLAWLLTTITIYNLRMLDLFRFAASLEAWTGMFFLISALGWHWMDRKRPFPPVAIALSTWWLTCSGHPQAVYYSFMGVLLFLIFLPAVTRSPRESSGPLRCAIRYCAGPRWTSRVSTYFNTPSTPDIQQSPSRDAPGPPRLGPSRLFPAASFPTAPGALKNSPQPSVGGSLARFYAVTAGWVALGLGMSMAYLLPFYFEFMLHNGGRVGQTYQWANSYSESLASTVNNFFLPLRSNVHGAFGGPALFLPLVMLPLLRLAGLRLHRATWPLWALGLLAFLHMQGARTPVHYLAWKFLPLASNFRVAARISQVLPIVFLLLALLGLAATRAADSSWQRRSPGLLAAGAAILYAIYPLTWRWSTLQQGIYTPQHINRVPISHEAACQALGLVSLVAAALCLYLRRPRWPRVLLAVTLLGQLGLVLSWGTWLQRQEPTPTWEVMRQRKQADLRFYEGEYGPGDGLESDDVLEHEVRGGSFQPELARICSQAIWADDRDSAYEILRSGQLDKWSCVLEGQPSRGAGASRSQSAGTSGQGSYTVELTLATFNRQVFQVQASAPAWLLLRHPLSANWRATVNDSQVELRRADALVMAVPVPRGTATVDLRYHSPSAQLGALLSVVSTMILGLLAVRRLVPARLRPLALPLVLLLPLVLGMLWYYSLYAGRHLGTQYTWTDGQVHKPHLAPELERRPQVRRAPDGRVLP